MNNVGSIPGLSLGSDHKYSLDSCDNIEESRSQGSHSDTEDGHGLYNDN